LAAYTEGAEWLGDVVKYLQANRDFLMDAVENRLPGLSMRRPEGTFLAWIDCSGCRVEGEPHQFFIENAKVAMNRGGDFGTPGMNFVRLNFGCPRSTLEEAVGRIEESLKAAGTRLCA
jgi:cystathionine beta-lyase